MGRDSQSQNHVKNNPIMRLWRGDLPLKEAFWTYAVIIGFVVNAASTLLFMALIAYGQPGLAALVGYGLSIPYNVLAMVGVWRSSERYDGAKSTAELARVAGLVWVVVLSVT